MGTSLGNIVGHSDGKSEGTITGIEGFIELVETLAEGLMVLTLLGK